MRRLPSNYTLQHLMENAEGRKVFSCESCGKSYKWKESLLKHQRIECGKLPNFFCEICGNRFMHKHHLIKHMASIHQITPVSTHTSFSYSPADQIQY